MYPKKYVYKVLLSNPSKVIWLDNNVEGFVRTPIYYQTHCNCSEVYFEMISSDLEWEIMRQLKLKRKWN